MYKTITIIFLFFIANKVIAQQIKGKVIAEFDDLSGVNIENRTKNIFSTSDKEGYFEIKADIGDMLLFSAVQFNRKEVVVQYEDLKKNEFFVRLTKRINAIEEVEVEASKMSAVSMGILSKPAKKYTPAERRLKTAGDFKPIQLLGLLGGSMPLDPVINAITGRTKKLKKEVTIEKKELAIKKLSDLYSENYYLDKLKIPQDYIKGFQYYLAENEDFKKAIESKNKKLIDFIVIDLASKYLELLKEK